MGESDKKRIDFETEKEFKDDVLEKCKNEGRTLKGVGLKLFGRWLMGKIKL